MNDKVETHIKELNRYETNNFCLGTQLYGTAVFEYLVVFFCPLTIVYTSHYPVTALGGTVGPCPFASTG